jgi:hypothetical protein
VKLWQAKPRFILDHSERWPQSALSKWSDKTPLANAMGHKNDVFVGSDRGSKSAAITYTLMETAKLNSVDPQA